MARPTIIKILKLFAYFGVFVITAFIFLMIIFAVLFSLPEDPQCGGFQCLDRGFLAMFLSIWASIAGSWITTFYLYWRFEKRKSVIKPKQ
ncbi:MAG: hypothetical protein LCI00_04000 [Chloroflexi bacterium]|nr:hypothetical protein [Chloroflexota bacterium]MCC6891214.1 hypothetical protein [Anaerolineae bacterium]